MSRGRSDREASPKAAESPKSSPTEATPVTRRRRRSGRIDWSKVKVFEQPEYRLPWQLAKYTRGKNPLGVLGPEPWVEAAIESGLVVMDVREGEQLSGEWFEPLGDNPPPQMTREELEGLIAKGIADLIDKDRD